MPCAHITSWLLVRTIKFLDHIYCLELPRSKFPEYKLLGATNRRRGAHGIRSVQQYMTIEELAQEEEDDMALREAEAGASLVGLMGGLLTDDSDSDSDDKDHTIPPSPCPFPIAAHDHEAGGLGAVVEDTLPTHTSMIETLVYVQH